MIKCEKCDRPAEHLVIIDATPRDSDWPICDQCLLKNFMMKERHISFATMQWYVSEYEKPTPTQIGGYPRHPELDALLERARNHTMNEDEIREQRISFAHGNRPEGSTGTKEDMRKAEMRTYGPRAIDLAWAAIDRLRCIEKFGDEVGTSYNRAIDDAIETVENLGGRDPENMK